MTNNIAPATAGDVIQALIDEGYDAGKVVRAVTRYNGSAFMGVKMSRIAFDRVEAMLNESK